jgi:ABC-2 type transport system ATP-binding protein
MLKVDELSKNYGDLVAVDKVSFEAGKGKVFGLLGPNGAGKSTTINCISARDREPALLGQGLRAAWFAA